MDSHKKTKVILITLSAIVLVLGARLGFFGEVGNEISDKVETILKKSSSSVSQVIQIENIKELQISLPGPLRKVPNGDHEQAVVTSITQQEILDSTNSNRNANGSLKPLTLNSSLNASAQAKLDDMFTMGYFEHTSPRGVVLSDLVTDEGYEYIIIGENLALGDFTSGNEIVREWMNSPGHRANILNTQFTEIGIAVKQGTYDGQRVWMAVQHFGAPLSLCEKVDLDLKNTIEVEEKALDRKAGELEAKKKEVNNTSTLSPEYNDRVDEYNALAEEYNVLLTALKKKINVYNKEVNKFNDCTKGI